MKMAKEYDLIVVGAGPAGLMAAKTAGENGLTVAVIERKDSIPDINRACSMMVVTLTGKYLEERVHLNTRDKKFCFPGYGFTINYDGPHQDFYTWSIYSHKGNKIQLGNYEENVRTGERVSAVYNKEALLRGLLGEACAHNVEVFNPYNVVRTAKEDGKVRVFTREGRSFKGTFVIAADGRSSRIAQSLGFNRDRAYFGTAVTMGYEMVGVEPAEQYALFQIFLNEKPSKRIWMTPRTEKDTYMVMTTSLAPGSDHAAAFERFSQQGFFASWFKRAEIKRTLTSVGNMLSHIVDPYKDQVLLVSDAVWCQEAEMTGAVISGWKAANAVTFALLEGKISREGVAHYLNWWNEEVIQKYDYRDMVRNVILPLRLTPDEIDFVLGSVTKTLPSVLDPYETPKLVGAALAEVMPTIAKKRPTIFKKLSQMREVPLQSVFGGPIRGGFPMNMHS
jgi:digeranylgeranylglycerophospholipid reductase